MTEQILAEFKFAETLARKCIMSSTYANSWLYASSFSGSVVI